MWLSCSCPVEGPAIASLESEARVPEGTEKLHARRGNDFSQMTFDVSPVNSLRSTRRYSGVKLSEKQAFGLSRSIV
jgi:hypothetical protein